MLIVTANCTVMGCSRRGREGKQDGNTGGKQKGKKNEMHMVQEKKMIENYCYLVHSKNSKITFTVIILPRERRGHLWRGWTRACEYKYDLKLCAFNVGKKKNI